MRRIFLSHSFSEKDRELVSHVESIIRSHGLIATNGRILAGGALTPEIKTFIEEADALVALATIRGGDPGNPTHSWVLQELGHARFSQKPAIALYEKGITVAGTEVGFEHIDFDRDAPHLAYLKLSETLGEWKRRAGRLLKMQIIPEDVARSLGSRADRVVCECRFQIDDNETDWKPVKVRREIGGVFFYLRVPESAEMVQIRSSGPPDCESSFTPIWMPIRLDPRV
jgi:hypothetical protein